ncbi:MAG TPA: hypothetical protein VGB06_10335, partial [Solirubrobacterales bacterium]
DAGDADVAVAEEIELPQPHPDPEPVLEPVPEFDPAPQPVVHRVESSPQEESMEDTRILEPIPAEDEIRIAATPWLDEVGVEESTLDFPAIEGDVAHRERIDTPRVRHLFPVPEDADWGVRELKYDHYGHTG